MNGPKRENGIRGQKPSIHLRIPKRPQSSEEPNHQLHAEGTSDRRMRKSDHNNAWQPIYELESPSSPHDIFHDVPRRMRLPESTLASYVLSEEYVHLRNVRGHNDQDLKEAWELARSLDLYAACRHYSEARVLRMLRILEERAFLTLFTKIHEEEAKRYSQNTSARDSGYFSTTSARASFVSRDSALLRDSMILRHSMLSIPECLDFAVGSETNDSPQVLPADSKQLIPPRLQIRTLNCESSKLNTELTPAHANLADLEENIGTQNPELEFTHASQCPQRGASVHLSLSASPQSPRQIPDTNSPNEPSALEQSPENKYWCTYCGHPFKRLGDWRNHEVQQHDAEIRYKCYHSSCQSNEPLSSLRGFNRHHHISHSSCKSTTCLFPPRMYYRPVKLACACGYCGKFIDLRDWKKVSESVPLFIQRDQARKMAFDHAKAIDTRRQKFLEDEYHKHIEEHWEKLDKLAENENENSNANGWSRSKIASAFLGQHELKSHWTKRVRDGPLKACDWERLASKEWGALLEQFEFKALSSTPEAVKTVEMIYTSLLNIAENRNKSRPALTAVMAPVPVFHHQSASTPATHRYSNTPVGAESVLTAIHDGTTQTQTNEKRSMQTSQGAHSNQRPHDTAASRTAASRTVKASSPPLPEQNDLFQDPQLDFTQLFTLGDTAVDSSITDLAPFGADSKSGRLLQEEVRNQLMDPKRTSKALDTFAMSHGGYHAGSDMASVREPESRHCLDSAEWLEINYEDDELDCCHDFDTDTLPQYSYSPYGIHPYQMQ